MAGRKVVSSLSRKVDGEKVVVVAITVVEGKVVTSARPTVVISGIVLCAVDVSSSGLPVVPGFTDVLSSKTSGNKELLAVTLVAEVAVTSPVEASALSVVTLSLSSLVKALPPLTA